MLKRVLIIVGVVLVSLIALVAGALYARDRSIKNEDKKYQDLTSLLSVGALLANDSQGDRHFDGGASVLFNGQYEGNVTDLKHSTAAKLRELGYTLVCPSKNDSFVNFGDSITYDVKPNDKCRFNGRNVNSVIWFYQISDQTSGIDAGYMF